MQHEPPGQLLGQRPDGEALFASLKKELVHHEDYPTREQAKASIFEYIEVFYNRARRHSTLGYQSPADYEAARIG